MNLDELSNQWAALDRKLEFAIRLNTQQLRESAVRKSRTALQGLSCGIVIELLINVVAIGALGLFMVNHVGDWRFLAPALLLVATAIGLVAFGGYQLEVLARVDFGAPVVAVQRQLGTLKRQRIRAVQWTLLLAPLLWTPLLIVGLKGLLGVDAYAVLTAGFLVTNALFGLAAIPLLLWASRRFARRFENAPWMQRLMDDLAGRSLARAAVSLDSIARFERREELV